jgi:hypothetical protein
MRYTTSLRVFLASALSLCIAGCAIGNKQPEPFNQIVIMIDSSGSYRSRQVEAVAKAAALLESMGQTKVRRWEETTDQITLISLDAVPEVIWQGSLVELKKLNPSDWVKRFNARTDYAACTDVAAAFRLADSYLNGDPLYVDKYLFAFSDLIAEPPTSSIRTCQRPAHPSLPPDDFAWDALHNVSVSIFWVPPDQKLAWQRAVAGHGLSTTFSLYTTSESSQVKIQPPPRAAFKESDEERAAKRDNLLSWTGKVFIMLVILLVALVISIILFRLRRRVRPASLRSAATGRPLPQGARRRGQPPAAGPLPPHRRSTPLPGNRQR